MATTTETVTGIDPLLEELTSKTLPEVKQELAPISDMPPDRVAAVETLIDEIDMSDSNSIIFFGTKAQQKLTTISDNMLEGVRNKDIGPASASLNEMVATLRGFDIDKLDPNNQGFFARIFAKIFGGTKPVVKFIQRYEDVRKQIDTVSDKLEGHKTTLLKDVASLDRLYEANLDYFHELEDYILAGEKKLELLDSEVIPALAQEAKDTNDMIKAQELRDLRTARDDLERRVHDLRLTRQVTMQSLPSIRLVQENDKGLVRKIQSTMANTIPLWRQQLAQAVTIYRSGEAAKTVKAATDLTNELLESNAENLQEANREVREQIERGVFDIDVVKRANQKLIDTIEESLKIADEGKRMRASALTQLQEAETALKEKLAAAHSRASGAEPQAGA